MDRELAISGNRDALLRIVAALFAMAGLADGGTVVTLPRHLRNRILRILRPAESAVRRLIVIVAAGLPAETCRPRGKKGGRPARRKPSATGVFHPARHMPDTGRAEAPDRLPEPSLPLLDRLKIFSFGPVRRRAKSFPRISIIGVTEPRPIPEIRQPSPDDEIPAAALCRRLIALRRALDDLDGQAKRLARWKARRDAGLLHKKRSSPMRPGWPPGHRKRPVHEIDTVLRECHSLAFHALDSPDTS